MQQTLIGLCFVWFLNLASFILRSRLQNFEENNSVKKYLNHKYDRFEGA